MRTHPVFTMLDIPPVPDLDQVERSFLDHVKAHIQSASDNYNDDYVQREEAYLRRLYPVFFDYSILWIKDQLVRHAGEKPTADALKLKKEARQILTALQSDIIAFAICSMHISRYMTLVRGEIRKNDMRAAGFGQKKIIWTSEVGTMLGQSKKRKQELAAEKLRHDQALAFFATIQTAQDHFEQGVRAGFSREDAEKILRGFRSSLRITDFDRAARALAGVMTLSGKMPRERRAALQQMGEGIIEAFRKNAPLLVGEENKLFLSAAEIRTIQAAHEMENRKIRAIMLKYNLPYMEYKLQNLSRLLDKLMVIGSTEGLMTLYRKLIVGMAAPLRSLEDMRKYESEVLGLIKYLQAGQFQEIPKIRNEADKIVEEFRQINDEYEADMQDYLQDGNGEEPAGKTVGA